MFKTIFSKKITLKVSVLKKADQKIILIVLA